MRRCLVIVTATAEPTAVVAAEHSMKLRLVCVTGFQWKSNLPAAAHVAVVSAAVSQCVQVPTAAHVASTAAVVAVPVVQQIQFAAATVPSISPFNATAWATPPSMLAAVIAEHVRPPAKRKVAMLINFIVLVERTGNGTVWSPEKNSAKRGK